MVKKSLFLEKQNNNIDVVRKRKKRTKGVHYEILNKKTPDNFIKSVNDEISSILNRHFDNLYPEYGYDEDMNTLPMPVEITEKDKEYDIRAELPGVKKKIWILILTKTTSPSMLKKKKKSAKIKKLIKNPNSNMVNFQDQFTCHKKLMLTKQKLNWNMVY